MIKWEKLSGLVCSHLIENVLKLNHYNYFDNFDERNLFSYLILINHIFLYNYL
jgi:hypothetical protein